MSISDYGDYPVYSRVAYYLPKPPWYQRLINRFSGWLRYRWWAHRSGLTVNWCVHYGDEYTLAGIERAMSSDD